MTAEELLTALVKEEGYANIQDWLLNASSYNNQEIIIDAMQKYAEQEKVRVSAPTEIDRETQAEQIASKVTATLMTSSRTTWQLCKEAALMAFKSRK